jgi:hypothetical protein
VMTERVVPRQETGASSSGLSVSRTLYLGLNDTRYPSLYSALTATLRLSVTTLLGSRPWSVSLARTEVSLKGNWPIFLRFPA